MDDSALDRKEAAKHGRIPPDGSGAAAHPSHVSLEGVHSSVEVPRYQAGFWEQWRAFVGPAVLVSVRYMDPGNWGTDLHGGAQFKHGVLWVVGLASLMATLMRVISARLGVATGQALNDSRQNDPSFKRVVHRPCWPGGEPKEAHPPDGALPPSVAREVRLRPEHGIPKPEFRYGRDGPRVRMFW